MKTCLYSPCYLEGTDKSGSSRLERNINYLNYYWPLRFELGFEKIILADNHSPVRSLGYLHDLAPAGVEFLASDTPRLSMEPIQVIVFNEFLGFGQTFQSKDPRRLYDYPYCWRALEYVREIFTRFGFEKLIMIDTDNYVLSQRLAHYIRDLDSGWTTLWCPKYDFPEASVQIIFKDEFMDRFEEKDWRLRVGERMETSLPYTYVNKDFIGDRYGEDLIQPNSTMDFYGQASTDTPLKYQGEIK